MSTQEEPKQQAAPPPPEMIDALCMQLESGLKMMKCPDYVEKAARDLVAALQKWSKEE